MKDKKCTHKNNIEWGLWPTCILSLAVTSPKNMSEWKIFSLNLQLFPVNLVDSTVSQFLTSVSLQFTQCCPIVYWLVDFAVDLVTRGEVSLENVWGTTCIQITDTFEICHKHQQQYFSSNSIHTCISRNRSTSGSTSRSRSGSSSSCTSCSKWCTSYMYI